MEKQGVDYLSHSTRDIWSLICGHFSWKQPLDTVLHETSGLFRTSRTCRKAVARFVVPRLRSSIFNPLVYLHFFEASTFAVVLGPPWACCIMRRVIELADDEAVFSLGLVLHHLRLCYAAMNAAIEKAESRAMDNIERKMLALNADAAFLFQSPSSMFACHLPQALEEDKLQRLNERVRRAERTETETEAALDAARATIKRLRQEHEEALTDFRSKKKDIKTRSL